jgi:hypothetical protein
MSIFKAFAIVAPLALSTAALAAPAHMSDAQFIAASRCDGLMSSSALGRQDTHTIEARLKAESSARPSEVFDRADEARENALRDASHAGAYTKSQLIAERDGACRVLSGEATMSAQVGSSNASRTN